MKLDTLTEGHEGELQNATTITLRLRTGCSSLNYHLFCKNIINDELCVCGNREDTNHFLFVCPRFQMQRQIMVNKLLSMCNISLHVLLYGDNSLSFQ